jgi:hypothetical protein
MQGEGDKKTDKFKSLRLTDALNSESSRPVITEMSHTADKADRRPTKVVSKF